MKRALLVAAALTAAAVLSVCALAAKPVRMKLSRSDEYSVMTAYYPKTEYNSLNDAVRKHCIALIDDFKETAYPDEETLEIFKELDGKNELLADYALTAAKNRFVGVKYDVLTYLIGAAHPVTAIDTITLDTKTGKLLEFSDVFKDTKESREAISKLCKDALLKQPDFEPLDFGDWISIGSKEQSSFIITDKGIEFWFNQGDIAPMASDVICVELPYSALKPYMKLKIN